MVARGAPVEKASYRVVEESYLTTVIQDTLSESLSNIVHREAFCL